MKLSQFKFKLPQELIALHPHQTENTITRSDGSKMTFTVTRRDECKLMVLHKRSQSIDMFKKDADGKRVKEVVDGKKVTVYETVEKEIKKDLPSRLHARKQMDKVLYTVTEVPTAAAGKKKNTKTVDLTNKLFDEIAPKYAGRQGGYTRIVKIGLRKGDAAMEVLLELV